MLNLTDILSREMAVLVRELTSCEGLIFYWTGQLLNPGLAGKDVIMTRANALVIA